MARELTYWNLHKYVLNASLAKMWLNDKILDVWCWYGAFLEKLYNKWYRELNWIDGYIEPEFNDFNFTKWFLNTKLPYSNDDFDNVFCIEVIEHLENPFALIKEMLRVLKKGGRLYITSPNINSLLSKITFLLTWKLVYFFDSDVILEKIPWHITPFFQNIVLELFKDLMVLNKISYSEFTVPFTWWKVKLPFENKLFWNITIYEFIKK